MNEDFETLIAGYIETQCGISEHFISETLSEHLTEHCIDLSKQDLFNFAGTGNDRHLKHSHEIRSDSIYWLDRSHQNQYENAFLDRMEEFIRYLNESCYTGITDYEFHYSLYEAGSFYKQHLDQFHDTTQRQFSLINYLNAHWKESDGGHLIVQQKTGEQKIAPTQGKTVFFKSNELLHEVQVTRVRRMSISGWLKRD